MPRKHKRLLGSRAYSDYPAENIEKALEKVADGTLSLREASRQYKIPFGTLYNKFKGKHGRKPGRPTAFTCTEELAILKSAAKCADWGFPLSLLDIRMMAKYYLDGKGQTVHMFKNNLPGIDWTYSLLERHKHSYGQRLATNIKRSRASVSRETLESFYNNLENTLKNMPSSNIFNYDESNLSDDPGKQRCIYRRGVKYPEKIMNHSKSCTTIMMCGSADGTLLPPYVIYKSLHLYDSWKENGPRCFPCCTDSCCSLGTRYNRTPSGWLDGETFRDWFRTVFLPHAKRLEGRKALLGDNLSSHMDTEVLKMCAENDVDFICLVPNSTHLCQPLDVAFFRPMKGAWRSVLTEWKLQNLRLSTIPKDMFSALLKKCLLKMNAVSARKQNDAENLGIKLNLINGFRATGIFPSDRQQVIKKLPSEVAVEDPTNAVESALTVMLREQRFGGPTRPQRKKKRLQVAPGCSVSTAEQSCNEDDDNFNENCTRENQSCLSATCENEFDDQLEDDDDIPLNELIASSATEKTATIRVKVGQYVLGNFASQRGKKTYRYACKIIEIDSDIVVVGLKSIGKNKSKFKLVHNDVSEIKEEDIIEILPNPVEELDEDNNLIYKFDRDIPVLELAVNV